MDKENKFPQRKPTRLQDYDYSEHGAYFITICTQNRKNILSTINVGEGSPLPKNIPSHIAYLPQGQTNEYGYLIPELSPYGKIVDAFITEIPNKYPEISVEHYVIMPNHVHLLMSIYKDSPNSTPPTIDAVIGWLKYQTTKEINNLRNTIGEKVFQRSFYDHIVRNYEDYCEVRKYIHENPIKWQFDQLYSEE